MIGRLTHLYSAFDALVDAAFANPKSSPIWITVFISSGFFGALGFGHSVGVRTREILDAPKTAPTDPSEPKPEPFPSGRPTYAAEDPAAPRKDLQQFAVFDVPSLDEGEVVWAELRMAGLLDKAHSDTESLWVDGVRSGRAHPRHKVPGANRFDVSGVNQAYWARLVECCLTQTGTLTMTLEEAFAGSPEITATATADGWITVVSADDFRVSKSRLHYCAYDLRTETSLCTVAEPEPRSPASIFDPDWGGIPWPGKAGK